MVDLVCREAAETRLNPAYYWTFADEDFLGRIKTLAKSCHRCSMSQRVIERYTIRIFALVRARGAQLRSA